jgi:hypothetical protein
MGLKEAGAAVQLGAAIVGGILGVGSQAVTPNTDGMKAYSNIAELQSNSKEPDTGKRDDKSSSGGSGGGKKNN